MVLPSFCRDSPSHSLTSRQAYYRGDSSMPIYSSKKAVYSQHDIVTILLEAKANTVCSKKPTGVDANFTFIVDLSKLGHMKDMTADDNGSYIQHGSPEEHCYVVTEHSKVVDMVKSAVLHSVIPSCRLWIWRIVNILFFTEITVD